MNQGLHEASFGLSELRTVASIDGDIAKSCGAIVLNIDVRRVEELN